VNKAELLDLTSSERQALDDVFNKLTEDELRARVLDGDRSMKDELAHIADWERRVLRATAAAERGEQDVWPEPGYKMTDEDIDRLNQRDYLASRDRSLADVVAGARESFAAYLRWIEAFSEEQIAGELPYTPGIPLEAIIRANGDQHYREHLDQIEAWWAGQGA
jgi:hypothetical protein